MNNTLFTKKELWTKICSLKEGEKPYSDFSQMYVDELLDEMFPLHKKVLMGDDDFDLADLSTGRKDFFVLEVFEK